MLVATLQMAPENVPIGKVPEYDAGLIVAKLLAEWLEGQIVDGNPDFLALAARAAKGKDVLYITLHTEPAVAQQNGRGRILRG